MNTDDVIAAAAWRDDRAGERVKGEWRGTDVTAAFLAGLAAGRAEGAKENEALGEWGKGVVALMIRTEGAAAAERHYAERVVSILTRLGFPEPARLPEERYDPTPGMALGQLVTLSGAAEYVPLAPPSMDGPPPAVSYVLSDAGPVMWADADAPTVVE